MGRFGELDPFQPSCTVLVFPNGSNYLAVKPGNRGWTEVAKGTVAATVIQAALTASA